MNRSRASRIVGISVGQRLMLGLAPALLAVVLVLGLAYYGEIGRQAPAFVVTAAAALAAISLVVTWANTRYLAQRIRRLAGGVESPRTSSRISARIASRGSATEAVQDDELGRIEQVVGRLGAALAASETERRNALANGETRLHEQSTMLGAAVRDTLARLDEVRLPLHILIDAPFGDLNENQEELLVTARAAADAMDSALRRLMLVTDADRDALPVLLERVSLNELLRGVIPMLRAIAERRGARVELDLDPTIPRIKADRIRLAEAIALLGTAAARTANQDTALRITTSSDKSHVIVRIAPVATSAASDRTRETLANRLLSVQGATVAAQPDTLVLCFPIEGTA